MSSTTTSFGRRLAQVDETGAATMKLRAIVCVCIAGAAALRSPRKGVVGRGDRNLAASSGDERSVRAEVGGLAQREPKERVINGVPVRRPGSKCER